MLCDPFGKDKVKKEFYGLVAISLIASFSAVSYMAGLLVNFAGSEQLFVNHTVEKFQGDLESHQLDFQYGKIHYLSHRRSDSNVHLFAVHGPNMTTQSASHWIPNCALFDRIGSFHMLDLPGFGESPIDRGLQSIPSTVSAHALHRTMMEEGVLSDPTKRIVFVARSWGAEVVMMLFRRYPEVLDLNIQLVLISPTPNLKLIAPFIKDKIRALSGLIVWGERDSVIPSGFSRVLRRFLPKFDVYILKGVSSHQPETDLPGTFARIVSEWWEQQ